MEITSDSRSNAVILEVANYWLCDKHHVYLLFSSKTKVCDAIYWTIPP